MTDVIDFFTSRGIEELIYDTTDAKDNEIFQSLRNYIERVKIQLFRMEDLIITSLIKNNC
jgi:folate-binding Fe-S cluster repair protein YgfZ